MTYSDDQERLKRPTFGDPELIAARDRLREADRLIELAKRHKLKDFDPYRNVFGCVLELWADDEFDRYDEPAEAAWAEFPALAKALQDASKDGWITTQSRLP